MTPTTITVGTAEPYDVVVGTDVLDAVAAGITGSETVAVVSAAKLATAAARVAGYVVAAGARAVQVEVPDGEAAKGLAVLERLWAELAAARITRSDAIVAVGGGAVTDVVGFAAATWLRGVRVVHVPTTLLGMVDAAIGGKTAINTTAGKNLVGAVHQPSGVVVDLALLATLPSADLAAGLAEVVKAGFVADPVILDRIEADPAAAVVGESVTLREVVERAIRVKAAVVAADPTELGRREILNYGHTLAHAIEKHAGYGAWRHGDAVSIGLCFAAAVGRLVGTLDPATAQRHRDVLVSLGLPTRYDGGWDEVRSAMSADKKSRGASLRLVVLEGLARPVILDDPGEQLLAAAYAEVSG